MDSGVFFYAFDVVSGLLSGDSPATTNVRIAMEFHNQGSDLEERLTSGQQVCYLFFAFFVFWNSYSIRLRLGSIKSGGIVEQ